MAITFRVENMAKAGVGDKPVAWVSAVDGEQVICQIAVPYSTDATIFKAKMIERMTPYVRKYRNRMLAKQAAQTVLSTINADTEII